MRFEGCFEDGSARERRGVDQRGKPRAYFGVQWFVGVRRWCSAGGWLQVVLASVTRSSHRPERRRDGLGRR